MEGFERTETVRNIVEGSGSVRDEPGCLGSPEGS
jgi:hypothetical protein